MGGRAGLHVSLLARPSKPSGVGDVRKFIAHKFVRLGVPAEGGYSAVVVVVVVIVVLWQV